MFRSSLPAGKLFGVDLRIHLSFPILLVLAAIYGAASTGNALRGIGLWCALVFAVIIREIARSIAGAYVGLNLRALFLLPVGGLMAFAPRRTGDPEPKTWPVTAAGPIANILAGLLLIASCYALQPGIHLFEQPWISASHVLRSFVWTQFVIAVVGMLPSALPSRPVLKNKKPDAKPSALHSAFNVGTMIALGMVILGLALQNLWLICIGAFFFLASQFGSPTQQALASPEAESIRVRDVMLTEYTLLSASDTLAGALEQSVHSLQDVFPVVRGDRLVGAIARATLVERFQSEGNAYLQGIMTRSVPVAAPRRKTRRRSPPHRLPRRQRVHPRRRRRRPPRHPHPAEPLPRRPARKIRPPHPPRQR